MDESNKFFLIMAALIISLMLGVFAISKWSLNQEVNNAQMQLIEIQKLQQCKMN